MKAITQFLSSILPTYVARKIFHVGFNVAPDEFHLFAHEYAFAPKMSYNLEKLCRRGLHVDTIVDVGAYHGDWTRLAHSIWPDAKLIMVEGNTEKEARLAKVASDVGGDLHIALLGPEDGRELTFYVMESGSSVLEENSPLERTSVNVKTRRLDDIVSEIQVDLLKVDVQGFELEVLRGAPRVLQQVKAVLLEVSLIEVNKGAPLLAEVVGFMAQRGFEVADVIEIHRRPLDGATNQVDFLFVPKSSNLLTDTRHFS